DRRFKSYLVEFGLTPAARTKVNAHDGNKEEDPLSQFFG
ncbi:P27 family phage terminase small subunit, partial [Salmonella enterica]|nr:P27 family phage terminase small subunit [Salmonella enterica]